MEIFFCFPVDKDLFKVECKSSRTNYFDFFLLRPGIFLLV